MSSSWFRKLGRRTVTDGRLFCFPHAGGTAASFRHWSDRLPPRLEAVAVQLPGRADRLRELPLSSIPALAGALANAMEPYLEFAIRLFWAQHGRSTRF